MALLVTRRVLPPLKTLLSPPEDQGHILARIRRFVLQFLPLILPLMAYLFTGVGEGLTRSLFGEGAVIAFGKRVFLFLAARILVKEIIRDPFLKMLGRYVLIPVMALYAVGLLDVVTDKLTETVVNLGNISFSVMALVRGVIAGSRSCSGWAAGRTINPPPSS